MAKQRADFLLVTRGLAPSRAQAQRLVMAGQVRANGEIVLKPSSMLAESAVLAVDHGPKYVSRGGDKLAAALDTFPISVAGAVCADVGASTGGFTDCLLQAGAARVYAIDVGQGILHWKLRSDPRVVVMEETNARYVESLPESVRFVSIDASFISVKILLPVVRNWLYAPHSFAGNVASGVASSEAAGEAADVVILIKPQFEAGRKAVARGQGVVRDAATHRSVLQGVLEFAVEGGWSVRGLLRSPVLGPKGNVEFLAWLVTSPGEPVEINPLIDQVLE